MFTLPCFIVCSPDTYTYWIFSLLRVDFGGFPLIGKLGTEAWLGYIFSLIDFRLLVARVELVLGICSNYWVGVESSVAWALGAFIYLTSLCCWISC